MKDDLDAYDADAVIIGSGVKAMAHVAARMLGSLYPLLYDPDRSVYRAWGLEKRLGLVQRSGTFVVDVEAIVRFAHIVTNPVDALPSRAVKAMVQELGDRRQIGP
ncbi:MAG: peroxiredoxin family protein [Gemmatimonadetes bacterium]|nr:peroxiredoxin family protein [Gemmatimonadota bacterium]